MPRGKDLKPRKPRSDRHSDDDLVLCKDCGCLRRRGVSSKAGLCYGCSVRRVEDACYQLRSKQGAIYERWLEAVAKSKINMRGGNHA